MARQESLQMADELKAMVSKRLGIPAGEIQCPREKSDMTPCVARDGSLAVADGHPDVCVGCDLSVRSLHTVEKASHHTTGS